MSESKKQFEIDKENGWKICRKCNTKKDINSFRFYKRGCYAGTCENCAKLLYETVGEKQSQIDLKNGFKICNSCQMKKELIDFSWEIRGIKYSPRCKQCQRQCDKRRIENMRKNNPDKLKELIRENNKNRKKTPKTVVCARMSKQIRKSLRFGKGGKKWQSLVDFSLDDLKRHLESKFTERMSWELFINEEIEIDHYYPVNIFRFNSPEDYEFKLCWNLKNLTPLWKTDNATKSDRLGDGRFAKNLSEKERVDYLIKMKVVSEGYVYKEKSPEPIQESGEIEFI